MHCPDCGQCWISLAYEAIRQRQDLQQRESPYGHERSRTQSNLPGRFDEVCSFLPDPIHGHLSVASMQLRHNRCVDDSQALDAAHLQLLIQHGHLVAGLAHCTGACGVVAGCCLLFDVWHPVFALGVRVVRQVWRGVSATVYINQICRTYLMARIPSQYPSCLRPA